MADELFTFLGLHRLELADFGFVNDRERQPAPGKMSWPAPSGARVSLTSLSDPSGQEPVDRLVSTIVLCALRDGAARIVVEPQPRGVAVRFHFTDTNGLEVTRDHLRLPTLTLEPIVTRLKQLIESFATETEAESRGEDSGPWRGRFEVEVDGRAFALHVSIAATDWGERIQVDCQSL